MIYFWRGPCVVEWFYHWCCSVLSLDLFVSVMRAEWFYGPSLLEWYETSDLSLASRVSLVAFVFYATDM